MHGAGRAGLLALGIAAAAAALAAVLGGSLVAQDEALARALQRVPAEQRSVSIVYSDLGRQQERRHAERSSSRSSTARSAAWRRASRCASSS